MTPDRRERQEGGEARPPRSDRAVRRPSRRMVVGVMVAVAAVGALLHYLRSSSPPSPRRVAETEPAGFGKARFGVSPEEVKILYPQLEELKKGLGAVVVEGPLITRWVLWKQELPGLPQPTDVELRFWKNQLWVVIVYFGANDLDTVVKALTERYGPPRGKPASAVWQRARSTIIVAGKAKWYSVQDNAISREAQAVFIEDFKRSMEQRGLSRHGTTEDPTRGLATSTPAAAASGNPPQ